MAEVKFDRIGDTVRVTTIVDDAHQSVDLPIEQFIRASRIMLQAPAKPANGPVGAMHATPLHIPAGSRPPPEAAD